MPGRCPGGRVAWFPGLGTLGVMQFLGPTGRHVQAGGRRAAHRRPALVPLGLPALLPARVSAHGGALCRAGQDAGSSVPHCVLLTRPSEGSRQSGGARSKRALEEEEGATEALSKNKQKKKLRNPHKTFDPSLKREPGVDQGQLLGCGGFSPGISSHSPAFSPAKYAKCEQCGNPKVGVFVGESVRVRVCEGRLWPHNHRDLLSTQGNKCVFDMCRACCKKRAFRDTADCPGGCQPLRPPTPPRQRDSYLSALGPARFLLLPSARSRVAL